jgi:phosphoribosylaminoimidazolecarboxamide formyltransferase/IMP cyclohydrolase
MRALISVSDKTGIVAFAKGLEALGVEIISTGGTKKTLEQAGIACIGIEEVTGFPEMMDGRVKTLHPLVHGGLLGKRDDASHMVSMAEHGITPIDLVVVNLYPFKATIQKDGVTLEEAIENIDIGGPSMLRSGAKNYHDVTVVIDPADYEVVLAQLEVSGQTTVETRQRLAAKVFRHTAQYDALIASFLTDAVGETLPESLTLTYDLKQTLRYGENAHQAAACYQSAIPQPYSIAAAKQLHGKELSFNNIRDADAALRMAREFSEPTVVALKHMNPCGIGTGTDIESAWDKAYDADPVSIFGGVIVLNREVDAATADKMSQLFLEIVIAPSYSESAFDILSRKKNIRLLQVDFEGIGASVTEPELTGVLSGMLVQQQDVLDEDPGTWQVVTDRQPTADELEAMTFAWKAVKGVKSNAILIANAQQTLGVGAGQMNRVGSVRIAIDQAKDRLDGAVLASDAYFPFSDNVEEIGKAGIKAIVQPGGSIRDQESIDMANRYGIAMVFTDVRHFRH